MASPRKGQVGRDIHLSGVSTTEPFSGDEVYAVWMGPLVRRRQGTIGSDPDAFDVLPNVPGFERDPKGGLHAWIIKREYVSRFRLWAIQDGSNSQLGDASSSLKLEELRKRGDVLDILATHVHKVPIATGSNEDVIQSMPDPARCGIRADANERKLNTGIIVTLPDSAKAGYRGVPVGERGRGSSPVYTGRTSGFARQTHQEITARMFAALESLRPNETIYGATKTDVRVPSPGTTHVTDSADHTTAIRVSPDMVSIDRAARGSSYSVENMQDPNRFTGR